MKNTIALFGVPRSGTSWLGQIFDSCPDVIYKYQPLFSYAFKNRLNMQSSFDEISNFFDELKEKEDEFLDQTAMRERGYYPKFEKNLIRNTLVFKEVRYLYMIPHLLKKIKDIKMIFLVRNPVDVIKSWINAPSEYKDDWDIYEEWYFATKKNEFLIENYYGYAKWQEAVVLFYEMKQKYPENVMIVNYDELCSNAIIKINNIFEFCGLDYLEQTKQFLIDSQTKTVDNAYGVYRNKNQQRLYKRQLPEDIINWIQEDTIRFLNEKYIEGIHDLKL